MIIAGVGLTVLVVLVVGVAVARKVDGDSANYLVAGRRLGVPLVAVSLTAAAVDSNATVGNTDLTSQFGFWSGASLALGLSICLLLTGLFLAKPINRMKLFTLGDYFRIRYGRPTEVVASVVMLLSFVTLLAGNLVACGFLLERFARIPYAWGVLLSVLLVLAYTVAGGLFSDAYTAVIQTAITLVAAVSLLAWVALSFGIVVPAGMGPFDLGQLTDSAQGAPVNWATLVSLGIGDIVAIDFMQRIFGAKSPEVAQRSCFAAAGFTAVIGTVFALVALTASAVLGITTADGPVLYTLLAEHAPPLLAVVVLSGIVAASFSTASGAILATSAIAVRNLWGRRRIVVGGADPLLRWTRLAMVPICALGALLAIRVSQTGILLTLAFDLMLACLAAPFVLGVFWRRPGAVAALTAAGVGLVVRLTLLALTPTLYGVPNDLLYVPNTLVGPGFDGWATLVAAVVGIGTYVLVGWLRPRPADERASEAEQLAALDRELADVEQGTAPAAAGAAA
ncbi:sodium:solute symporter family protein [Cellulomonas shaoxiangyii]|uniref:Sodium:solute symporter n=1 Tax=Cellulomonas shaoxiangyii TaxID=2566013 RepID=A0A4V1CMU3_9CELL|nr:sodium:solute symporter family protein [Cellulomonas shaoxiangyii]QCB94145.1 sodium:solute symporter [Cellulomonas shaoxiangyii]TGY86638.1 sodium:solute symporter [Cellulomonas shaoxiangyii]